MKIRRVLIALGVMLIIVLAGLYWEGQRSALNLGMQEETTDETLKTPDINVDDWDVSDSAKISLDQQQASDTYQQIKRFSIPGRVVFPPNAQSAPVQIRVHILPVEASRALDIQRTNPENPKAALLKGGPWESLQGKRITRTLTTDENGKFSLEDAPPGVYRAVSADTDWSGHTQKPTIQAASQVTPLELSVKQNARLIGHVVTRDSEPIADARVPFLTDSRELSTDDRGRFVLERLEPEKPIDYLKIMKKRYRSHYLDVAALEPGEIRHDTFVLKEGANLRVRVRTPDGNPVTDGRLMLRRLDDKRIRAGADYAFAHGDGRMKQLGETGDVFFSGLQPGKIKIYLAYANYLSKPMKLSIQEGKTAERTLEVMEGKRVRLRYLNERTGEPVEGVRPKFTVYNAQNTQLDPGFKFRGFKENGILQGVVHPEAHKLSIRSESQQFKPKTSTVTVSELPDLEITLTPSQTEKPDRQPPGLLKINLSRSGKFRWDNVTEVRVYVLDRKTGRRILGRAGHRSTFEEPFPLKKGQYVFYAVIKTTDANFTVTRNLDIQTRHPGQKSVTPDQAATITGEIRVGGQAVKKGMKIGVSLIQPDSTKKGPAPKVYFPEPLTTTPNEDGTFEIPYVPPGSDLGLQIVSQGGGPQLDLPRGKVVVSQPLPTLSPGEERRVATINLQP